MSSKHKNPYRGKNYKGIFSYIQKKQVVTIAGVVEHCVNELGMTPERAKYSSGYRPIYP